MWSGQSGLTRGDGLLMDRLHSHADVGMARNTSCSGTHMARRRSGFASRRDATTWGGFTLVELLVVIAIIGVLVALLLPAVQAAREAARRTQCKNQVKQMMLSMHNHESAKRAFPSGGIGPWPNIANYLSGPSGSPLGPDKQGLSWAFQILPYLEGQATYNVNLQTRLQDIAVPMYNCPSRRPPTQNPVDLTYLMDYAAAVPSYTVTQRPPAPVWTNPHGSYGTVGCGLSTSYFWTTKAGTVRFEVPSPSPGNDIDSASWPITSQAGYIAPMGVIVRSDYCAPCKPEHKNVGWYTRISFEKIEDGSSNTLVIGEKRLQPYLYAFKDWHDDRGWTDGWDPDTLRCSYCQPAADADVDNTSRNDRDALPYSFGGAHAELFNAGFADASVRSIRFDVDLETLNMLANRLDGGTVDPEAY
jgi:prepilin-type N-terminal cleavage/methylation domain-containing protein